MFIWLVYNLQYKLLLTGGVDIMHILFVSDNQ